MPRLTPDEKRARKIEREMQVTLRHAARLKGPRPKLTPEEKRKRHQAARDRWLANNLERKRAVAREYVRAKWAANPEFERQKQREYRARKRAEKLKADRAPIRAYKKAWRRKNLERELARGRADSAKFRKSNPESVRASQRKWKEKNREYFRQFDRDRYEAKKAKSCDGMGCSMRPRGPRGRCD